MHLAQQGRAVHMGHARVADDHVYSVLFEKAQCLGPARGQEQVVGLCAQ